MSAEKKPGRGAGAGRPAGAAIGPGPDLRPVPGVLRDRADGVWRGDFAEHPVKLPWRGLPPPGPVVALPGPPGAIGPGPFGAIHGQFTAARPGGGYQMIDTQRGAVTAVSARSITVRSGDGYTKTYQVTPATEINARRAGIGWVKTGQTVFILATVHGPSATATQIVDVAALPSPPKMPQTLRPGSRRVLRFGPCASWSISR